MIYLFLLITHLPGGIIIVHPDQGYYTVTECEAYAQLGQTCLGINIELHRMHDDLTKLVRNP